MGLGSAVRAAGLSLILPYFVLYLRNVLGLGYLEIGGLSSVVAILPLAIAPFAGLLADRVGRRRVFLISLLGEALGVVAVAFSMEARSLEGVVAFVIATACAGTIAGPAISAYYADFSTGSDRTRAFTTQRIGWNVGFTLGVLSGGGLLGLLGFAGVGFGAGILLGAAVALLAATVQPSRYDRDRSAGLPRGEPGHRSGVRETIGLLSRDRVFLVMCASMAIAQLAIAQWSPILPLYANTVLGIPYSVIGIALALNGLLVVVAQAPTTTLALGHRHTTVLQIGILLYAGGFLLLALVALVPAIVLSIFFASIVVLTIGENVASIPFQTLPSNFAPPTDIAAYNGAFSAIVGIGQLLAPAVGGVVLASTSSPAVTWSILMIPVVPALLLSQLYVVPRIRASTNRA
ncbi:MAG TPA: MFS transporter [Thermoplasmata archaeon]|nr:MFS transporter [Thermoplasmata archaeon]